MAKSKIFVYKIAKPSASKITEIVGKNNRKLNQTKINGKQKDKFQPLLSASTRKLATGLDINVDNPYKGKSGSISNPEFKFLEDPTQERCLLQYLKEVEYNLPKGYLDNRPGDPREEKDIKNPSFYHKFIYQLNDGVTVFDRELMVDDLAVHAMEASKFFANSRQELDKGLYPYALYYLAAQDETDELKYNKKQLVDKAKAELTLGSLQDSIMQKKFVKLLLPEFGKKGLTNIQAYNLLSDNLESNTRQKDGQNFIDKFNKLIQLLKTAEGREKFEAMVILQESVNFYLMAEKAGTYTWLSKDIRIGQSKEEAVQFILNPEKTDYVDELMNQIKAKKQVLEII